MKQDKTLEELLDRVWRLMAMEQCAGRQQVDQILILHKAGVGPGEIADFLGTTSNTVNVALSRLRKEKRLKLPGPVERKATNGE